MFLIKIKGILFIWFISLHCTTSTVQIADRYCQDIKYMSRIIYIIMEQSKKPIKLLTTAFYENVYFDKLQYKTCLRFLYTLIPA